MSAARRAMTCAAALVAVIGGPGLPGAAAASTTASIGTSTITSTTKATVTSALSAPTVVSPGAGTPGVTATLAGVAPQVASPSTDISVRVTVRNDSDTPLRGLRAQAQLLSTRFTERGAVGAWLAGGNEKSSDADAVGSAQGDPVAEVLQPGATTEVTVTIPRNRWRLGRPFAVVPVLVRVIGAPARSSAGQGPADTTPAANPTSSADTTPAANPTSSADTTSDANPSSGPGVSTVVASTRTVVPWTDATQSYVPLGLAWAVPLTAPADAALFSEDADRSLRAWEDALGPGSVIRSRLEAAGSSPVTWVVDPSLLDGPSNLPAATPSAPATPSSSPSPSASTPPLAQTPSDQVRQLTSGLADALKKRPSTQNVWSLPPGDPDTASLTGAGLRSDQAARLYPDGATALDTALGTTIPRDVAWPADGAWPADRTAAFRNLARTYPLTSALVSTSSIASRKGFTAGATARSSDGTGLLAYDEELSRIAGGTAEHSTGEPDSQLVQRFLAESLVLLGEREGTARDAIVALPRDATVDASGLHDLLAAAGSAPWLRTTTLPAVAAGLASAQTVESATTSPYRPASPLTTPEVRRDETRAANLRGIGGIVPATAGGQAGLALAGDELFSARWRQSSAAYRAIAKQVDDRVTATRRGVQVSPANVNFLTDAGAVAITVANDLPYPVSNVRLRLVPGNGRLRVDRQPDPVSIKARSRATVRVDVTALGSGEVPVVARLMTPSGVELGTARTVTMNVRPPAEWILWVIGAGLLLVLVAGLARTLTRQPTRAVRDDLVVAAPRASGPPDAEPHATHEANDSDQQGDR